MHSPYIPLFLLLPLLPLLLLLVALYLLFPFLLSYMLAMGGFCNE
nr:MAG TPA: hypothetical protein [Caudoviricetes sp.]